MWHKSVFREEDHSYLVDGRPVPSVTQVLREIGLYGVRFDYLDDSYRIFGTAVHKACALYLDGLRRGIDADGWGRLDPDATDERVVAYVDQFRQAIKALEFRPELIEEPVCYSTAVAGTLDAWGESIYGPILIDIKASMSRLPAYRLQTAAYQLCLEYTFERESTARMCVYLSSDKFSIEHHQGALEDRQIFLEALSVYQWKANNKLIETQRR